MKKIVFFVVLKSLIEWKIFNWIILWLQIYTIYFKCDSIRIDFQWNSKIKAII
jgi:hypothetical protein